MLILGVLTVLVGVACSVEVNNCRNRCSSEYVEGSTDACSHGCSIKLDHSSSDNLFGIDVECQEKCAEKFSTNELRGACYRGCTFVEPTELLSEPVQDESSAFGLPSFLNSDLMRSIFSLMGSNSDDHPEDGMPVIHRIRIRVFVPENPDVLPMTSDMLPDLMETDAHYSSMTKTMCHRFRSFMHHITARPIFFATILLVFVNIGFLLIFCLIKLRVNRMRQAAANRQIEKIYPAFLGPAALSINLSSPQPYSKDEADGLPAKLPIV